MRLIDLIPKSELEMKLKYGFSELDKTFLCFEQNYEPVSKIVPKDFTIVDMGCYQAAQCYFFSNHSRYYGVDCFDVWPSSEYIPPLRFRAENTVHCVSTIQDFLKNCLSMFDLDKTYFIASAVPDHKATDHMFNVVKNCLISYPGELVRAKGVNKNDIESSVKNYFRR